MIVKCISNRLLQTGERCSLMGYNENTTFDVSNGNKYVVYGMCLWGGNLLLLCLSDSDGYPNWYPAALFEVLDTTTPSCWQTNIFNDPGNDISALWGYEELVNDANHFNLLSERDSDAFGVFWTRKADIDTAAES